MYLVQEICSGTMEDYQAKTLDFIKNTWQRDCIYEIFEAITDDFMYESPLTNARGFEWFAKYIDSIKDGFSDIDLSFRNIYSDNMSAVAYYTVTAKHTGSVMGIPATGKNVKFDVFTYLEFDDNEIRYMRTVYDLLELKTQLGIN